MKSMRAPRATKGGVMVKTPPRLSLVRQRQAVTPAHSLQFQLRRGDGHGKLLLCRPRFAGDVVRWLPWYSTDQEALHILPSPESAALGALIYGGEPEAL
jgi:hypothetical protein